MAKHPVLRTSFVGRKGYWIKPTSQYGAAAHHTIPYGNCKRYSDARENAAQAQEDDTGRAEHPFGCQLGFDKAICANGGDSLWLAEIRESKKDDPKIVLFIVFVNPMG